jgi:hypothetical protein
MYVIYADLALAAWLLVSAFVLGHTPLSAPLVAVAAVVIGALVWASTRRPGLRFVNTALTFAVAALGVTLPGLSVAARINTILVGLVLMAMSAAKVVYHHGGPAEPHAAGPGGTRPPAPD